MLFVNRKSLSPVWRRRVPLIVGLAPGVYVGTRLVAQLDPSWMKLWTFVCLLPLILFQAAGYGRPLSWGPRFGVGFGGGLGVLCSVTTISGPPLALLLSNESCAKNEFRAALGLVRLAESSMTAVAYWQQSNRGCLLVAAALVEFLPSRRAIRRKSIRLPPEERTGLSPDG